MKEICNICSWEYDKEWGHEVCAISYDNRWEDIPNEFKELLPSGNRQYQAYKLQVVKASEMFSLVENYIPIFRINKKTE